MQISSSNVQGIFCLCPKINRKIAASVGNIVITILAINQINAQNLLLSCLLYAYTCFEHMCSSSGGQNCVIQHLVSSQSVGGRPVHRLRADCAPDGHLQSVMIPDTV